MATLPNEQIQADVASIFLSYFDRAPEFQAMEWYAGLYIQLLADQGDDPAAQDNAFKALSAQIYADGVGTGEVPAGPTITNEWYVNYLYNNVLGRDADEEGFNYWVGELNAGTIERSELVGILLDAAQNDERDAAYVNNRTEVAVEFSQWENSNPQILDSLQYNAAEVLIGVNEDPATVAAAQERLNTTTGQEGQTYQLTKGIDTVEGTSYNDTINAYFEGDGAAADSTLTNFDSIDGGAGWDTLNVYVGEAGANSAFPDNASVTNVEVVNLFGAGAADESLTDASNYEGVVELWQIDSARDVTELGEGTVAGFRNVTLGAAAPAEPGDDEPTESVVNTTVTTAKDASSVTVKLDNVSGDITEDGDQHVSLRVEGAAGNNSLNTFNVLGTLANNANGDSDLHLVAAVGAEATSVVLNTEIDTDLTVENGTKRIDTIDASGSTGDVLFNVADSAAAVALAENGLAVTLGSGNDVVIFGDERALGLSDELDGGDGYDILGVSYDGKLQTQDYDTINLVENFEAVALLGEDVNVDASALADFDLLLAGTGDIIVNKLAADQSVVITDNLDDTATFKTVQLVSSAADLTISVEGAGAQLIVEAGDDVGPKNGALTLDGEGGVAFSNADAGKFSIIDASDLEGFDLDSDKIPDEMNEGIETVLQTLQAADVSTLGLVLADLDGGELVSGMNGDVAEAVFLSEASDVIAVSVGADVNSSTLANMDVVVGFNEGDNVDFLLGFDSARELELSNNATSFELALSEAATEYGTGGYDGEVLYFHFDGSTYLYANTTGEAGYDNADFVLEIVGEHEITPGFVVAE